MRTVPATTLRRDFPIIFLQWFSQFAPAWPSGIVSSEVPGSFLEFPTSTAISFLPLFRNMMKALPLPSPKVMLSLRCKRYYGQIRLPCQPGKTSFPYIYRLPSSEHRHGPPAFIIIWPPLRVTPVTPGVHLSVVAVFVEIDAPVFPPNLFSL